MKDFINRWIKSEDAANRKLFLGKTINTRFQGLRQSERNQAKAMLIAGAPVLALAPFVPKWADASPIESVIIVAAGLWATLLVLGGTVLALRSIIRGVKKPSE